MITVDELHRRMAAGERFKLIDVREPGELAQGWIPGAVNVPLFEFKRSGAGIAAETELPLVLVCHSGLRSLAAVWAVRKTRARSLRGGMAAWKSRGFEVIRDQMMRPTAPARKPC